MIITIEKMIYDFLCEKMKDTDFKIYRGFLPEITHEDKEEGRDEESLFPFLLLKVEHFKQTRMGIDTYEVPLDFQIWIGTKENKAEDYIKNLSVADNLRKELLKESTINTKFSIDESHPFTVDFYNEENKPFFYSMCKFRVLGIPEESEIVNKEVLKFLGRSK